MGSVDCRRIANQEGARAPATGRGWPGPAGTVKINGKVLMAGAQL